MSDAPFAGRHRDVFRYWHPSHLVDICRNRMRRRAGAISGAGRSCSKALAGPVVQVQVAGKADTPQPGSCEPGDGKQEGMGTLTHPPVRPTPAQAADTI